MKLTIEHVIDLVDQLPKNNLYDYVSGGKNKAKLIGVNRDDQKLEILTNLSNLIVFLTEAAIHVLHLRLYLHIQQSSMHVKLIMSST